MCKVLIVHYSMYGHIYRMAEAVAEGVREVPGCEAIIKRVPETLSRRGAGADGGGGGPEGDGPYPDCHGQ